MVFIYIQTLKLRKTAEIPFRITLNLGVNREQRFFDVRPQISISNALYKVHNLDKANLVAAPLFYDIADELIELFQDHQLVCLDRNQFNLIRHQFSSIGFNFNIRPFFLFKDHLENDAVEKISLTASKHLISKNSLEFAQLLTGKMALYFENKSVLEDLRKTELNQEKAFDFSNYKRMPGVYFFLDEFGEVLYVGKAKNIKKRLQSHFSRTSAKNNIDYSRIETINVQYTGNDIIAQLIESDNIKSLKPIYNTQQVVDPKPFVINKGKTAKGINKLSITQKNFEDNLPEKYFNRHSVKKALEGFCSDFELCRKHCGIERVKGPCSNHTVKGRPCVCAGTESVEAYNKRFDVALYQFRNRKIKTIYKLKGRNNREDAFIYMLNGIYEGYGFIDKEEFVSSPNDILGHLVVQKNTYDTTRILSGLDKYVRPEHILPLSSEDL